MYWQQRFLNSLFDVLFHTLPSFSSFPSLPAPLCSLVSKITWKRWSLPVYHDYCRFFDLSSVLELGKPAKIDKPAIIDDAIRVLTQLRNESQELKETNEKLLEEIKNLKVKYFSYLIDNTFVLIDLLSSCSSSFPFFFLKRICLCAKLLEACYIIVFRLWSMHTLLFLCWFLNFLYKMTFILMI